MFRGSSATAGKPAFVNRSATAIGAAAILLLSANYAHAAIVTFSASDIGIGPGVTPTNSNAEASLFDSAAGALGTESVITYENAPLGPFTSLTAAPGVIVTGIDYLHNNLSINNTPYLPGAPALAGFNTTVGGGYYLNLLAGTATYTFTSPVQAFGSYFTGVQPSFFNDTITFNDGASQTIAIPSADRSSGGVSFAGFTDQGASISSVTVTAGQGSTGDFIGIDDTRFVPNASTPEPATTATFGIMAIGLGGLILAAKRKKLTA